MFSRIALSVPVFRKANGTRKYIHSNANISIRTSYLCIYDYTNNYNYDEFRFASKLNCSCFSFYLNSQLPGEFIIVTVAVAAAVAVTL